MSQDRYYIDNIIAVIMTAKNSMPVEQWAEVVIKAAGEAGVPSEELRSAIYAIHGDELNEE